MDEVHCMTENTNTSEAVPSDGAASLLCTKCDQEPRAPRGSWCRPCRREYQRAYNTKHRPRPTVIRGRECAAPDCNQTFDHQSVNRQLYCSRACFMSCYESKTYPRKPDSEKSRARTYARRGYGITPEMFDELVEAQDGRCLICDREERLVPDHCHDTNRFRGPICGRCNIGLGQFKDNPDALRMAADYIECWEELFPEVHAAMTEESAGIPK